MTNSYGRIVPIHKAKILEDNLSINHASALLRETMLKNLTCFIYTLLI